MLELFLSALPSPHTLAIVAPITILFGILVSIMVGRLRVERSVRTAYTRKLFHFSIFTMATVIHIVWGLPGVTVLGIVTTAIVVYALWRGDGYSLYEALARPTDAPKRTLFIVVPLITTALGGIAANVLFARFAYIGYLVCGWGDAVGEPVGSKWGRHQYRVPSLSGVPARRSIEGSTAVFIVGSIAAIAGFAAAGYELARAVPVGVACGFAGALVEAVSNHGVDNFTTQLAAAAAAQLLA